MDLAKSMSHPVHVEENVEDSTGDNPECKPLVPPSGSRSSVLMLPEMLVYNPDFTTLP